MRQLKLEDFAKRSGLNSKEADGLILFDYGLDIQFNFDWDEISLNARGIVFEKSTGKLIARGFPKFFNWEELQGEAGDKLPEKYRPNTTGAYRILEKLDGSMGLTYWYNGEWRVNTRGAFYSDQAVWAKKWLDKNIHTWEMGRDWTYIFEIIYPENRIVVNYGKKETLALTGIINTETGEEVSYKDMKRAANLINCEIADIYEFEKFEDLFRAREKLTVNEEGFVVTFENGYKCKIKGEAYCKVHRILSNVTPLHFWRAIDIDTYKIHDVREIVKELPEEFRDMAEQLIEITEKIHQDELERIMKLSEKVPIFSDNREGNRARYEWMGAHMSGKDASKVYCVLTEKWNKLRDFYIHRECRPTLNNFDNIQLDKKIIKRLTRILNNVG